MASRTPAMRPVRPSPRNACCRSSPRTAGPPQRSCRELSAPCCRISKTPSSSTISPFSHCGMRNGTRDDDAAPGGTGSEMTTHARPSTAVTMQYKHTLHPIVRIDFLVRRSTYPFFGLLYLTHITPRGFTPLLWIYFLAHVGVFPYAAYWIAKRSENPKRAELRNLLVDSFLIGGWVPLLSFSLWPSVAGVFGMLSGAISVGGPKFAARAMAVILAGRALMTLLVGLHVHPESSLVTSLLSMTVVLVYLTVFSLHSYTQSQKVVRGIKQIGEQNQQIKEKRVLLEVRTRELERLKLAAEEANHAKSQFLA